MKKQPDSSKVISQPFEDLSEKPSLAWSMKATKRKGRKKKAIRDDDWPEPYRDDDWPEPYSYSSRQKMAILNALPIYSDGEAVLKEIQEHAGRYLSEVKQSENKPKPKMIGKQLKGLEGCLDRLQAYLTSLHDPTLEFIDASIADYLSESSGALPAENFDAVRRSLQASLDDVAVKVEIAQRQYVPQNHRQKNMSRLEFTAQLYELWISCGNSKPTRVTDRETDKPSGPFFDFVCACLEPVDGAKGVDRLIRTLIEVYGQK